MSVHPVLFTVFGEPVHAYAATTAFGYVGGALLGMRLGRSDGREWVDLVELAIVVVLSALLGTKVFHVLFEAAGHRLSDGTVATGVVDLLRDDPWHWARLFEAGYVYYGGVVGAVVMGVLFCLRRGIPDIGAVGDYGVPGMLLGTFVGRIGCFLAGCCYGSPSSVPWAVVFPAGHPSQGAHVHPVQLYDAAYGLVGFILAMLFHRRRRFGGELLCAYAASYAVFRFGTEMMRADADRGVWLGGLLSTSQLVALVTLPVALVLWWQGLRLARAGKMRKPGTPFHVPVSNLAATAPSTIPVEDHP